MSNANEIILYQPDEAVRLEVLLGQDTVWLTLDQMSLLFGRDKSTISRHIKNIFKEEELLATATVAKFATVQTEGGRTVLPPVEGIFYEGQIFDAYEFASKLVKSAKRRIVLIDNYVDETALSLPTKRSKPVAATIRTGRLSKVLQADLEKHNEQYPPIDIEKISGIHDRFLIVDDTVYHIGASLKDLGKKLFAFSKMSIRAEALLGEHAE